MQITGSNKPVGVEDSAFLTSKDFSEALGQVTWLMTMSADHKQLPISVIDERILPAIVLKQFKVLTKGKMPIAFLAWATVSDEVQKKFEAGREALELKDWRSGDNLMVVECISPFGSAEVIKSGFIEKFNKSA